MEKQLTKTKPKEDLSIESFIHQAIISQAPVETMEKLLAMRRELKAEYAKEQFDKAMAKFQFECPVIRKTKDVKTNSGAHAYYYAPLEVIVEQTRELLKNNGFSYSIETETIDQMVKSTCIAKHEAGHSERSSLEVPLGTQTPMMSKTQVFAAAITFAKRYAFCNIFGIMTGDEDTDAPKKEKVDQEEVADIIEKISEIKNLEELKTYFSSLGKLKLVKNIVKAKDQRKQELTK